MRPKAINNDLLMAAKPPDRSPTRRVHDQADRRSRRTRTAVMVLGLVAIAALIGVYWWYSGREVSRDGAPSWSPDSQSLVFSAETAEQASDILIMNADGSGRRRIGSHAANDSAPAMSPDGRSIAFESDRDGNYEIYVMDSSGENVRRLTNDPARDLAPAWSPDGARIVFTSDRDARATADVYTMRADGSDVMRLTSDLANWAPQYAPDGRTLALQINRDVYLLDIATRATRRLTVEPQNGMNPTWSPDGQRLAFVSTRNGRADIFTMNADGTDQKLLVTMAAGNVIDPRWSPDGARIAFVLVPTPPANEAASAAPDVQAIYTIDIASGTITRVSR